MTPSLAGIDAKLQRAVTHINNLQRQVSAFAELEPYSVRVDERPQQTGVIGHLTAVRNPSVTIKSYQYKHAFSVKYGIFVHTTVVLDGDFAVTRTVPEAQLQWKSASMMKGARLEARLSFAESQKEERFALLYTRGRFVGRPTRMADILNVPPNVFIAETTADGNIEAEMGPITNK